MKWREVRKSAVLAGLLWACSSSLAGDASGESGMAETRRNCHVLKIHAWWRLNAPDGGRFDSSGLLRRSNGDLITVSDRDTALYRIKFLSGQPAADLVPLPQAFTSEQLAPFAAEKTGRWDCEGIAEDSRRRLYVCEEGNRWILRWEPKNKTVERLDIDWNPVKKYFHPADLNASFEGIAVGKGKLYVANERQKGMIIVVHLASQKVTDHFVVRPSNTRARDIHFSDLCWFEGALYALVRESRVVLKIDPGTRLVSDEYRLDADDGNFTYKKGHAVRLLEGLAVDRRGFWLAADNNGSPGQQSPHDARPLLFHCLHPDK